MNKKIIMVSIIAVPLLVGGLDRPIGHWPTRQNGEPAVSAKQEFADAPLRKRVNNHK